MPRTWHPYTAEGRAGLARVIAYERKRFRGWVRRNTPVHKMFTEDAK